MAVEDDFRGYSGSLTGPATGAVSITKSDTADLTNVPRALYCTGAGNVSVVMLDGQTVILPMVVGQPLPVRVTRVRSTGTTATGIVGVW